MPPREQAGQRRRAPRAGECHRPRASTACKECRTPYGRHVPTWQAAARRRRHEPAPLSICTARRRPSNPPPRQPPTRALRVRAAAPAAPQAPHRTRTISSNPVFYLPQPALSCHVPCRVPPARARLGSGRRPARQTRRRAAPKQRHKARPRPSVPRPQNKGHAYSLCGFHGGFCTPPSRANKQQPKSTPGGLSLGTAPKTRACAPKAHTPRAGAWVGGVFDSAGGGRCSRRGA
ncbi:MAG: hypothetical protein J3K34DRAFT_2829 [Monoraphidium minutum]|nr:MAG: hypothetical protein J3K34DRAFT_2829 [Monoraphidium minutum]